jgi:hypothetical protein
VAALGVHRVGGDHRCGDVGMVQQDREHRDLVCLGADFHLDG